MSKAISVNRYTACQGEGGMTLTNPTQAVLGHMRIDKWLWAARFYKTRSLAAQAIAAGHVKMDGHTVKAARELRCRRLPRNRHRRHRLELSSYRRLNEQRRPASEAQQLYEETAESRARRVAAPGSKATGTGSRQRTARPANQESPKADPGLQRRLPQPPACSQSA
jgi:ribosome-associated heat shock protein Hsp15